MKKVNFTIDEETLELLRQLAAAEHESVSNYLRRLIRDKAKAENLKPTAV